MLLTQLVSSFGVLRRFLNTKGWADGGIRASGIM
jgi:hypothetical protein